MKKYFFVIIVIISTCTILKVHNQSSHNRIFLLLGNIEAFASSDESGTTECPNGGQKTRGEAENKQWEEEYITDSEGKVYAHGQTLDFGAEMKHQSVSAYCYSVECPGKKGSCTLCNVWCKS